MAGRKLVRDLHLYRQPLFLHLTSQQQVSSARVRLISSNGYLGNRRFSVFNEFSKQFKGEATKNHEFQQSVKELKEKAEELKGVKEDLKVRTKQTSEQLYKRVDGAWTEAEATAKKVSANVKEKISTATEEVKGTFGIGKEEVSGPSGTKSEHVADDGTKGSSGEHNNQQSGEYKNQQSGSSNTEQTFFGKFRSSVSSSYISSAFSRVKEAKITDLARKGYDIVRDELSGTTTKRKHLEFDPSSTPKVETSSRTDIVAVPRSRWSKKWEAFRMKMQGYPIFKRLDEIRKPVTNKTQEIAEDIREHWETSDSPIVHKIQDLNETIFQETDTAASIKEIAEDIREHWETSDSPFVHKIQDLNETIFQETDTAASIKEIRRRDPSFSLPDFLAEVQDAVKPVLNAYIKGDLETLKKYCSREVIERCKAEHDGFKSHGIFFDHKILHISEAEIKETKMMGHSPIIIVMFQTQQVYCVRDRNGDVTEGGKDTIHTVYYAWAMQQVDLEELSEGAIYPIWKVREMQQFGVQALI